LGYALFADDLPFFRDKDKKSEAVHTQDQPTMLPKTVEEVTRKAE